MQEAKYIGKNTSVFSHIRVSELLNGLFQVIGVRSGEIQRNMLLEIILKSSVLLQRFINTLSSDEIQKPIELRALSLKRVNALRKAIEYIENGIWLVEFHLTDDPGYAIILIPDLELGIIFASVDLIAMKKGYFGIFLSHRPSYKRFYILRYSEPLKKLIISKNDIFEFERIGWEIVKEWLNV